MESFEGDIIESRAAVSVIMGDATEPVFGAVWMTARVSTDRDERTVTVLDIKVPRVRFPGASEEHQQELSAFLEREIPKWNLVISLDRLLTSLELAEREAEAIKQDSPGDEKAELPEDFAEIPVESDVGGVRTFVAGTEEAKDAVLDNSIPQTSAVKRSETLTVTYDGDPKFEPIEDTEMKFAVNTSYSVIQVEDRYYACHEAVWFTSGSPLGPWVVADEIPSAIYTIPPDSPVYNTRYVYVYESTPEVVYVGYTPGYTGSYVYHTTVVYGTGWYYPGWYGRYYYPRPRTWGFSARYNPWYGWSFGLSWSNGPFTFSIGYGGWWGPRGYGHGYHRGYSHGYHHGYQQGARAGYRAGQQQANRDNIYNRPDNRKRNADRPATSNRPSAGTAAGKPNNVYTDKNGDVYRRDDDGWQKREGNDWKKTEGVPGAGDQAVRPSDRPSTAEQRPSTGDARPSTGKQDRPSSPPGSGAATKPSTGSTRPSTSQGASGLERDYQARQQGTSRTNNYNHSRSASPSRGTRGGGGRRR